MNAVVDDPEENSIEEVFSRGHTLICQDVVGIMGRLVLAALVEMAAFCIDEEDD